MERARKYSSITVLLIFLTYAFKKQDNAQVQSGEERRQNTVMSEEKTRNLDEQYLGTFIKSYSKRYEEWKRKNLLLIALRTLPKQVKKENVPDNLQKLRAEFEKRLSDEG